MNWLYFEYGRRELFGRNLFRSRAGSGQKDGSVAILVKSPDIRASFHQELDSAVVLVPTSDQEGRGAVLVLGLKELGQKRRSVEEHPSFRSIHQKFGHLEIEMTIKFRY